MDPSTKRYALSVIAQIELAMSRKVSRGTCMMARQAILANRDWGVPERAERLIESILEGRPKQPRRRSSGRTPKHHLEPGSWDLED
jgi:hypothetical protein